MADANSIGSSAALCTTLYLLGIYLAFRAMTPPRLESPAVWGACAATLALGSLSFLNTLSLLGWATPNPSVQVGLRLLAIGGILHFWWYYRAVQVVRPIPKVKPNGA